MKLRTDTRRRLPGRVNGANPNTLIGGVVTTNLNRAACPPQNPASSEEELTTLPEGKDRVYSFKQYTHESVPEVVIENTLITIFGYDELIRSAVIEVNNPDPSPDTRNGVNDPRLGCTEEKRVCATCHFKSDQCPGHLGYIKLEAKVYHPYFTRLIIRVLNCVCNCCGCLYIPIEELRQRGVLQYTGVNRLKEIERLSSPPTIRCLRPQDKTGQITDCTEKREFLIKRSKEEKRIVYALGKAKRKTGEERTTAVLDIDKVFEILRAIDGETAQALMFENGVRPEDMILRAFPVIPPNARPAIYKDGTLYQDDLTKSYMQIIRINQEIRNSRSTGQATSAYNTLVTNLNKEIKSFIDNTDGAANSTDRKEVRSIQQQIVGKKGVIRGQLMGKRVDFSARTVISPDPSLKFGQLRIPRIWAPLLTKPVTLRSYNIDYYQRVIDGFLKYNDNLLAQQQERLAQSQNLMEQKARGEITSLGSRVRRPGEREEGYKYINPLPIPITWYTPAHGKRKGLRVEVTPQLFRKIRLQEGDIIDRWLRDGDYVVGNRNPTLHRQGFMGFQVVLGDPLTVGLHISYTTPMNADFDGDEINIHDLQTLPAEEDLREVMGVRDCLMNAQSNKPSMGVVYDGLIGAYLLTKREPLSRTVEIKNAQGEIERREIPNLNITQGYLSPAGDVLIPLAIRNDLYLLMTEQSQLSSLPQRLDKHSLPLNTGRALFSALLPADFYYNRGGVLIVDGVLIEGTITKSQIGPTPGSIIQVMLRDYGVSRTTGFLTDVAFVLDRWMATRGYTVGLEDCYPANLQRREEIDTELAKVVSQIEGLGVQVDDPVEEERRERQIQGYIDAAKGAAYRIGTKGLTERNNIKIAIASGAKGTDVNLSQITGILGQQSVRGGRFTYTLTNATRCLPYFKEGELDPQARGFCVNSFMSGLSPAELFFHQAATRETVMESSVKTPVSGTIQDVLAKAFESFVVAYDGSVRDANDNIISFVYGGEGFSAEQVERVSNLNKEEYTTFVNLERLVGRINNEYGYGPKRAKEEKLVMEVEKEILEVIEEEEGGE